MPEGRILIIEDNPDNLELISFILRKKGYTILNATNGASGLALAQAQLPDLVVLDLAMPALDGWQVAQRLKTDPATAHIRIMALTAMTEAGDRQHALEAGCDSYFTKPLDIPAILEQIQNYLPERN